MWEGHLAPIHVDWNRDKNVAPTIGQHIRKSVYVDRKDSKGGAAITIFGGAIFCGAKK